MKILLKIIVFVANDKIETNFYILFLKKTDNTIFKNFQKGEKNLRCKYCKLYV